MFKVCNLIPYEFVHTFGDLHLYANHREQAELQIARSPKSKPVMLISGNQLSVIGEFFFDFLMGFLSLFSWVKQIQN